MIGIDTNILVYSQRRDSAFHSKALACVREVAESGDHWMIPWPCVHEFLSVVTNPRIYRPATTMDSALDQVIAWTESSTLLFGGETPTYLRIFSEAVRRSNAFGAAVHDIRVAAICIDHGVTEFLTADRGFPRLPQVRCRNPLV